MKKKILIASILTLCMLIVGCYSFAANNVMNNPVNSVRNVVGGAENVVEDAARGVTDTVKGGINMTENGVHNAAVKTESGLENAGNMAKNTVQNTGNAVTSKTTQNPSRYNATRTMASAVNTGVVWTWLVVAIVALAIIGLIWYYTSQKNDIDSHM